MNKLSNQKFIQALEICESLVAVKRKRSTLPCEAIQLFCEIGENPSELLDLCQKHRAQIERAQSAVEAYARTVDNWKAGDCPFGVKDHCNILHFFLNLHTKKFEFFRAKSFTPEMICEFLKDWKGIDLKSLLRDSPVTLSVASQVAGD